MFEARLKNAVIIKKVLDAIKDLLNEASFDCTENGIELQAMDNSHVSLVSLLLKSSGFDAYRCDRHIVMPINLVSMNKIFKCATFDDAITIRAQDDADIVTFTFEAKKQEKVADYEMKLLNLDRQLLEIPETNYSCVIRMPSIEFARICRDLWQFGDFIMISCTEEGVKFSTADGVIGSANVKIVQTASVTIEMQAPISRTFSCRYLNSFTKATSLANQVVISMSDDVPLAIEYAIPDFGHIRYYLAPNINIEDD